MLLVLASAIAVLLSILVAYPFIKSSRLPRTQPAEYLKVESSESDRQVIVLAGDSLTHGVIGYGYVDILNKRLDSQRYRLINAGVNAHLAWNLSERLEEIIACRPSIITILIGTNDANAATSEKEGRAYVKNMKLPRMPDKEWYREILISIIRQLKTRTSAQIAVLSIPTIGEEEHHPAYILSVEYGQLVKDIAAETQTIYLPLQERMVEYLKKNPGSPTYPFEKNRVQMLKDIFSRYVLMKEWDKIAERAGFQLHSDYLHLNSKGAEMIADLITEFVKSIGLVNQ